MMVHCSTTMASYVGMDAFGSPSLPSWKMKTLSTDLGSISAETRGTKSRREKSIYRMKRVCRVSAASGPPGQRKWNDITQPHSHTSLYYIASGVGHLYEQCALYIMQGDSVKERSRYSPSGMLKKKRRHYAPHQWFSEEPRALLVSMLDS